ncbi:transporter substrate-binding domain-containing protein [Tumidithrix elongata RA019]|uniref:Transporter substrate-binding domain-containing protein n=1 Tax=Tumidithrix elongata BACA0141 TaxID=2716417 RepID=A0AAW9Q8J8_9CYAN|nr:transporter substrate-binding domain-containing protein [Tumidithrix elongata RA019]
MQKKYWSWIAIGLTVVLSLVLTIYFSVQLPAFAQKPANTAPNVTTEVKPNQTLRVVTRVLKPFVFEDGKELAGFSIDILRNIATELGIKYTLSVQPSVNGMLEQVKTNQADLGIAAVSITKERDKDFDFSYPFFQGGLQILVPMKNSGNSLFSMVANFFSVGLFQVIGLILLVSLIPVHIVWWVESRDEGGMLENKSYFPGIFTVFWWVLATLATQAEQMPRTWIGRVVAIFWMFTAVVFVAYFTATVTTSLTVQQLQGSIQSESDLPGKNIATIAGSTSANYLRKNNIQSTEVDRIEAAYDLILNGQADAVVFDAPVLLYYASHEGKGKVQVVGGVFENENYGIVFPPNSPLRRQVNNTLLTLLENGTYKDLYKKWFVRN